MALETQDRLLALAWLRTIVLCSMLALLPTVSVWACAICAPSAAEQTLTQRLFKSEAVALGRTLQQPGAVEIAAMVRGSAAKVGTQLSGVALAYGVASPAPADTVLLAYTGGVWNVLGAMPLDRAAWLDKLVALRRPADASPTAPDANWPVRFAFFQPDLESPVELVAQAAYDELSTAPYGAMRAAGATFRAAPLRSWLEQPALGARHPLYALMLGFVAKDADVAALQQRLLKDSAREPLPTVSALMAAIIEARGRDGMAWVQSHYLQAPQRSDAEVQAALLALRVHASPGGRIRPDAAVDMVRGYISANPQRAGFAASDLGDWGAWDFVADFERLLDTEQPQVFASRYAMVMYLLRCPQPEARAALERLRSKGRL